MTFKRSNLVFSPILAAPILLFIVGCGGDAGPTYTTVPTVTTTDVSSVTHTMAHCSGKILSSGGEAVTACGVCWSIGPTPTTADDKSNEGMASSSFTSPITGLTPNTTHYARAYATNSVGTGYGSVHSFTTLVSAGTITDFDGNVYQTVTIGSQVWMAENLRVTHYRDGTEIPNGIDATTWQNTTQGACCSYDDNVNLVAVYGRLYNWYAVADSRNIAPTGWHVPTEDEWQQLEKYLGMDNVEVAKIDWRGMYDEGGKLRASGTAPWYSPNEGATNTSGFSALPGGFRNVPGVYNDIRWLTDYWSSTENASDTACAWFRELKCTQSGVRRNWGSKNFGFSVRCVKD